ncbi:hypothetical protein IFM89_031752 [Coptis chinensis]|uniref:Uncharacterized protein n=1 Tax=Coptis chinensis TaxID=261450 RepID=A0A835H236_9MAGN|nr:hypothetical protein IFM89_031752 [Coptis chinensis]
MTVKREAWLTYITLVPIVTSVVIASGDVLLKKLLHQDFLSEDERDDESDTNQIKEDSLKEEDKSRLKNDGSYVEKIDKYVEFPLELDLQPFSGNQENDNPDPPDIDFVTLVMAFLHFGFAVFTRMLYWGAREAFFNGVPSLSISYDWVGGRGGIHDFKLCAEACLPLSNVVKGAQIDKDDTDYRALQEG